MDVSNVRFLPVTGFLLASTAVVTLPVLLQYIYSTSIALDWRAVMRGSHVWTPFTTFFYGGGGMPLLFDVFNLYRTSTTLEQSHFQDTAAYAWNVSVLAVVILVDIFGLISIPTRIYPFVIIALDVVQAGPRSALLSVMGILTGHFWWFMTVYLPLHAPPHLRRPNPFTVPRWYRSLFQRRSRVTRTASVTKATGVTASGPSPRFANANDAVRHRWGSGQRLGAE
ncbi:uncharacterized protein CcaverHIS019_0209620 [Cutaneotrichosporon cavernicola]|uniref:Derlin n=1 Tax=Cutaneotrichosporon cavernicola TaxID=279322 RepID=A0AA48L1G6_9TREE|nr:uncharacterized protein CcaverHIS019_0209620 [Cutaneotrichosporon cavernicola]BEI89600.1 hypothetical protein CcaverHIS019_0209620 [Cutaneotrichosporon cavernicola]